MAPVAVASQAGATVGGSTSLGNMYGIEFALLCKEQQRCLCLLAFL
jgi:hypothetical protein